MSEQSFLFPEGHTPHRAADRNFSPRKSGRRGTQSDLLVEQRRRFEEQMRDIQLEHVVRSRMDSWLRFPRSPQRVGVF